MTEIQTKNRKVPRSNITTSLLILFVVAMFVSPQIKGMSIKGLTKVDFSQPILPYEKSLKFASNRPDDRVLFENGDGRIIHLASLKGKVVFINFWATWCPPCIAEMPSVQKLYSDFKGNENVVFIMLDVDNNRKKSQKFMDRKKYDLPLYTPISDIPADYLGSAIPTTLVLNKYGKIVFKHEGRGDFSNPDFKAFIEQLIAE